MQLNHSENPIKGPGKSIIENAELYIQEVIEKFAGGNGNKIINEKNKSGVLLNDFRSVSNVTTVGFFQQAWGIPLICKGASVNFYNENDPVILSSGLNLETEISISRPEEDLQKKFEKEDYTEWLRKNISEKVESFDHRKGKLWFADIHPPFPTDKDEEEPDESVI